MISQTAEYALRAVVYLGTEPGVARTTAQIAAATATPHGYLSKVMQGLSRARLVGSRRGLHGGFTLSRTTSELTVLAVVNAVDAVQRIDRCPLGREAHRHQLCPLHAKMDQVMAAAEEEFRQTTLEDLIRGRDAPGVCQFPCLPRTPVVSLEGTTN